MSSPREWVVVQGAIRGLPGSEFEASCSVDGWKVDHPVTGEPGYREKQVSDVVVKNGEPEEGRFYEVYWIGGKFLVRYTAGDWHIRGAIGGR